MMRASLWAVIVMALGAPCWAQHTPVEFAQTGLAVVQRLRGHAQGAGQPLPDLPRARG